MKPIFSLKNIRKIYDTRTVFQCERLAFYPGRVYSLTGPNGAGKSTLLEILGMLQPPTRGVLEFKGRPIRWGSRNAAAARRCVTLVQQTPYLLSGTVHDNIAFGLRLRGQSGRLLRNRISRALEAVELDRFETRKACELSGGERQRVALARALALDPKVLLLDEPTANISKDATAVIEQVIATLAGQGKTVILSSHDPVQPQRLKSEIVHLHGGRVIEAPPVGCNVLPLPALPVIGQTACAGY